MSLDSKDYFVEQRNIYNLGKHRYWRRLTQQRFIGEGGLREKRQRGQVNGIVARGHYYP